MMSDRLSDFRTQQFYEVLTKTMQSEQAETEIRTWCSELSARLEQEAADAMSSADISGAFN
jgi:hypothetical protein